MASILTYRRRARRHGARYAITIIRAAREEDIPLSIAFALCEQESSFRNVFGHDAGGPFPGQKVTRARCDALIAHVRAGGVSNGVGFTQLTWVGYLLQAKHLGGLHKRRNQCRIGFRALKHLRAINEGDWWGAYHDYNGDGQHAVDYANMMTLRVEKWHNILIGRK